MIFVYISRFCPSMETNPFLSSSRSVDILYLDNTYCDPSCEFPSRVSRVGGEGLCQIFLFPYLIIE